jgi:hypothetical protein
MTGRYVSKIRRRCLISPHLDAPRLWTPTGLVAHCTAKLLPIMSSKHLPSALRACAPFVAWVALSACAATNEKASGLNDWERDASFGDGADDPDSGDLLDGGAGDGDGDGPDVHLRLLHGLINLPELSVCHDPDLIIDRPETSEDEAADGNAPPRFLGLMGAFRITTSFADEPSMKTGTLTLHRAPPPAPVVDAGAGDAGTPGDAGAGDGAAPDGGGSEAPLDRCDPATREAALPLPIAGSWLDPKSPPDLAARGIASTLEGGQTITLLASGLALDEAQLHARASDVRSAFLAVHPGDHDGADEAYALAKATLEAALGPRIVPALQGGARDRDAENPFTLSFAHLVPDVPTRGTEEEPPKLPAGYAESGALRLCVKIDDVEQAAQPAPTVAGLPFRMRSPVALSSVASLSYNFRVFAADPFDDDAKDCAGTSLTPVAELDVSALLLVPGRSYTLVAVGAIAPDELCTPTGEESLARASCPVAAAALKVRLELVPD